MHVIVPMGVQKLRLKWIGQEVANPPAARDSHSLLEADILAAGGEKLTK
jgi:hypothetical protein